MKTIEQIAAEILVKCGYATRQSLDKGPLYEYVSVQDDTWPSETGLRCEKVAPFSDTLEGRRQADAIENWLADSEYEDICWMYHQESIHEAWLPKSPPNRKETGCRQWRLDRIKWCLEQLRNEE